MSTENQWQEFEKRPEFICWATDAITDSTRERWAVIRNTPCPGLVWVRLFADVYAVREIDRSSGSFYDGAHDHPEGAIEWCKWGALKAQEKTRAFQKEMI